MSVFETNLKTFDSDVVRGSHDRPVLVDFWADWCAPCLIIAPVLEQVMAELGGTVALAKLEVDEGENMKLAGQFQVRGFPTLILFDKGREAGRFSGARSRSQVLEFIQAHTGLTDPA
ncbi:MAG: thioredoxin domain-containing protein [Gammaproteobacteria bacterium]|jgi:putative thioredoxin